MKVVEGKLVPTTEEEIEGSVADAIAHGREVGFVRLAAAITEANERALYYTALAKKADVEDMRVAFAVQAEYWIRTVQGYYTGALGHVQAVPA